MEAPDKKKFHLYLEQFREFIDATSPISEDSWKNICDIMVFKKIEKGVRLLDFMETENAVRFVGKGIVKCEDHYNEKSFVYDFRVGPIILAETVSFLNNTRSRITLETVTNCDLIELPRNPFFDIIFSHLDIAKFCAIGVANYLGMTHYKQALLRTLDAHERYKQFLKEFPSVALKVKLEDIASYIGITQQSLSRVRKDIEWRKDEKELEYLSNELEVVHGKLRQK